MRNYDRKSDKRSQIKQSALDVKARFADLISGILTKGEQKLVEVPNRLLVKDVLESIVYICTILFTDKNDNVHNSSDKSTELILDALAVSRSP